MLRSSQTSYVAAEKAVEAMNKLSAPCGAGADLWYALRPLILGSAKVVQDVSIGSFCGGRP